MNYTDPTHQFIKVRAILNVVEQKLNVRHKQFKLEIKLKDARIQELNDNIFVILEGKNKFRFKACSMEEKLNWVYSVLKAIYIHNSAMVKVEIHPVGLTK